jgi:microcystin-dependent protein
MDEIIGIIKLFAGKFAPKDWAFCDGSLLQINQYQSLYSIIGTTYGGDGRTTFALPDLRSRAPIGASNTAPQGLTAVAVGKTGGSENAALIGHTHTAQLSNVAVNVQGTFSVNNTESTMEVPTAGCSIAAPISSNGEMPPQLLPTLVFNNLAPNTAIAGLNVSATTTGGTVTIAQAGSSIGNYGNMPPFLGLNYIICIIGIYPMQSDT